MAGRGHAFSKLENFNEKARLQWRAFIIWQGQQGFVGQFSKTAAPSHGPRRDTAQDQR